MKKGLLFLLVISALILVSCSTSQIEVKNNSGITVKLIFRGQEYELKDSASTIIDKIPDGTFAYGTTALLESDDFTEVEFGERCEGTLIFVDHNTDYFLSYGSIIETEVTTNDCTNVTTIKTTYELNCQVSSSVPEEALSED